MNISASKCIHSRKIPALIDIDIENEKYHLLLKHMQECEECSVLYKECLDEVENLTQMIPKINIPRELQIKFEGRTGEFIKSTFPQSPDFKSKAISNTTLFLAIYLKHYLQNNS